MVADRGFNNTDNLSRTFGRQVIIDHGGGVFSQSSHLQDANVQTGDYVRAGQQVGTVGNGGNATRPEDHFEIRLGSSLPRTAGGRPVNPADYLPALCAAPAYPTVAR